MPVVAGRKYSYTAEGLKDAKKASSKLRKPMKVSDEVLNMAMMKRGKKMLYE